MDGQFGTSPGKIGQLWANWDNFGQIRTSLGKFGQLWPISDNSGQT